ncbi:hypothetical protein Goshw_029381, partial [Gossypium schwendimanii]|nr:hypothetical protein [Gossypium schwendimanii]
ANVPKWQVSNSAPPLSENWIQLSTDDDRYGSWILGYNQFIGIYSILDAQLWDIWNDLMIALDIGFDNLIIFSDSQEAAQAL